MSLSSSDLEALCETVLSFVSADDAELSVSEGESLILRSANNDLTTNGLLEQSTVHLSVNFGKRSASIRITRADRASLREAVKRVEAMARLAPEDPEFLPPVAPGAYSIPPTWSDATAAMTPGEALAKLRPVIEAARIAKVESAGYFTRHRSHSAYANSRGGFVSERSTTVGFSLTARTAQGRGSGWASLQRTDCEALDLAPVGDRAIRKALDSRNATARSAGHSTVVLEAAAARDLLELLSWGLDRREFDEGQSFLNGLIGKGGDPIGKALFGDTATVLSDPMNPIAPCGSHSAGIPLVKTTWIEKGVLKMLPTGRFWAGKKGLPVVPGPGNLILPGEGKSLEELIAGVEDGVLVTRLWYLRLVQPQTLLYTGLTRDGTFAIRDGKVAGPVNNYRFNETPVNVLKHLVASGEPERVLGSESQMPMLVPPLVVKDFNLSSVSDAS